LPDAVDRPTFEDERMVQAAGIRNQVIDAKGLVDGGRAWESLVGFAVEVRDRRFLIGNVPDFLPIDSRQVSHIDHHIGDERIVQFPSRSIQALRR